MAKVQITKYWIWIISFVTIIGLLIVAFPTAQFLSTTFPSKAVVNSNDNGATENDRTIYNPGGNILQGARANGKRPNFLFEFLERHDIESLDTTADKAWGEAMSSPLGGFLLVKHNETYNIGWGVSMFHSIHCLGMLRATMQKYFALSPENDDHVMHTHGGRDRAALKVDERTHVEHCLGYIGRALLCNGDDTLEPPVTKYDANGNILISAVNGQGHQHSCRDSTLAWQTIFASEMKAAEPFDWSPGDTIRSVFGTE